MEAILQLFDFKGFLTIALIFVPLEQLIALHAEQKVFRRGWWNDLLYVFFNKIVIQVGLFAVVIAILAVTAAIVPEGVGAAVSSLPFWLQVLLATLLSDIGFYVAHRVFHAVPWLWQFHAVHHSIEEMDWLAAARVHPVDQIVTKGIALLPIYALGFSIEAMGMQALIYYFQSYFVHANLRVRLGPLRWLIAGPEFHHWHHSNQREAWDKNFAGQLPFLDLLFGTSHMPKGRMPTVYGVDDPVPHTYSAQLSYPLKRIIAMARRRRARRAEAAATPGSPAAQ